MLPENIAKHLNIAAYNLATGQLLPKECPLMIITPKIDYDRVYVADQLMDLKAGVPYRLNRFVVDDFIGKVDDKNDFDVKPCEITHAKCYKYGDNLNGKRLLIIMEYMAIGDIVWLQTALRLFLKRHPELQHVTICTQDLERWQSFNRLVPEVRSFELKDRMTNFACDDHDVILRFASTVIDTLKHNMYDTQIAHCLLDPDTLTAEEKKPEMFIGDSMRKMAIEEILPRDYGIDLRSSGKKLAIIHAHGSTPIKSQKPETIKEIARLLVKENYHVMVIGHDRRKYGFVMPGVINVVGHTKSFYYICTILSGADVLIAPDSGFAHLSGVTGTPLVWMPGPFDVDYLHKYHPNIITVRAKSNCPTQPCQKHTCEYSTEEFPPCVNQKPAEVVAAVKEILDHNKLQEVI